MSEQRIFTDGHLFGAIGGGAMGFRRAVSRLGPREARFRCLGSIDVDPGACRAFERNVGVPATAMDLFDFDQYCAWHGRPPPEDWREATSDDIKAAMQNEAPDVGFLSPPCKGFSGLLAETTSLTDKYQALNRLTLRGMWLWLEAFKHDPSALIFLENVPRMANRGRFLVDQIKALGASYGYAVQESTHDCGELGGLAQSRKRFLLVMRHLEKVPPFLYEPPKRRLRGVGEILDRLPLPGDPAGGVMHRVPSLQWQTWVRLAFVRAGADWRSLNELRVVDGHLADYVILPDPAAGGLPVPGLAIDEVRHGGHLGVNRWDDHTGAVSSRGGPTNGNYAVADPRPAWTHEYGQLGVLKGTDTSGALINVKSPGQGGFSVADPRLEGPRFSHAYRIARWPDTGPAVTSAAGALAAVADPRPPARSDYQQVKYRVTTMDEASGAVIAASTTGNGAFAVADPRATWNENSHRNKLKVVGYENRAPAVIGADRVGSGALSVADPRPAAFGGRRDHYQTGGHYGVLAYDQTGGAVSASAGLDNGRWSVADPRGGYPDPAFALPQPRDRMVCVIRSLDDTWHRPFTTLELAALQSLVDPEDLAGFHLEEAADSARREWIGNAVPPDAAQAVGEEALRTLLMAEAGETFALSSTPIWVRQVAVALSVDTREQLPVEPA